MGFFDRPQKNVIRIVKEDPRECGCDDQYQVVEVSPDGRRVRVHGSGIRGYNVAENVKMVAERRLR